MKTFYQVLVNSGVSSITNMSVWFAITYFVYLETRSVFATSLISGIYLIATAATGIWFGSLVDHNKKKKVMLWASCISLTAYILGFVMYQLSPQASFADVTNPMLWIFVLLMMAGVMIGNIRMIVLPTLVTLLIPEEGRDKANGLVGTVTGLAFLVTSAMSGFLVGLGGMFYILMLAIFLTVCAIIHLYFLGIEEKEVVHLHEDGVNPMEKRIDLKGTYAVVSAIPGLMALIFFTTINNFLGGVFMALMDAYGLNLVSVEVWGFLWGFLSIGFIVGGLIIAKWGLGKNPLRSLFLTNLLIWTISAVFTLRSSIYLLTFGMFIYLCVVPFIEASEHTIIQKVVPANRQGRVFGFAQSVEQAASPFMALIIGPLTEFIFIPYMTTGRGVEQIGPWFGTGPDRGIALVFTVVGIIGLLITIVAMNSKYYRVLSQRYQENPAENPV